MKLYDCQIAPSPRRVRIFLAEKGLTMEKIEVDLLGAENLKPEYLKINPRGLVPTLELDDGSRIDEVVAICRYIEALHPNPPLMGTDPKSAALIESRNRHMEIDGFDAAADAFRNSAPAFANRGTQGVPKPVPAIPALAERGMEGLNRFFAGLESWLGENEYIAGPSYTIADITGLIAVDFAGWVKMEIPAGNKNTKRWYDAVSSRPSAKA